MRGRKFSNASDAIPICLYIEVSILDISTPSTHIYTKMAARFDPNFTDNVITSMGPSTSPRFRQLMTGLIQHVHDFARENELTIDEWMAGVQLMNWAGQMSDSKRNEGQLVCDVIGLESYPPHLPWICNTPNLIRSQPRRRNNLQTRRRSKRPAYRNRYPGPLLPPRHAVPQERR